MRTRTADIPMRTLTMPEPGALRSYVTRADGGQYRLSRLSTLQHAHAGSWRLTHVPSGATAAVESYGAGIALIRTLRTTPGPHEGLAQRFVIMAQMGVSMGVSATGNETGPAPAHGLGTPGTVVFDRATQRWFVRSADRPAELEQLEQLALLAASGPG